jgi:hypothetical protein
LPPHFNSRNLRTSLPVRKHISSRHFVRCQHR